GGLLFPVLGGYSERDIELVAAFDVSALKVGRPLKEAILQPPNNFVRIPGGVEVDDRVVVQRGPTLDGNPPHLALFIAESPQPPVDVAAGLQERRVDVLVNLHPTGSIEAPERYAKTALEEGCAFLNCVPTILAQKPQ